MKKITLTIPNFNRDLARAINNRLSKHNINSIINASIELEVLIYPINDLEIFHSGVILTHVIELTPIFKGLEVDVTITDYKG